MVKNQHRNKKLSKFLRVNQKLGIILENKVVQKLNLEKISCYKIWSLKLIFLIEIFFWKSWVNFWHWKLTLKVWFWHFLTELICTTYILYLNRDAGSYLNFTVNFWKLLFLLQVKKMWKIRKAPTVKCVKYLSHWWVEMDDELTWICLQLSFLLKSVTKYMKFNRMWMK